MPSAEFDIQEQRVIGLRLPNGSEIWPGDTWHGHNVVTAEDREKVVEAIKVSAANLGMDESLLLERYQWVVRVDKVYTAYVVGSPGLYPINIPALLREPEVVDGVDDSSEVLEVYTPES